MSHPPIYYTVRTCVRFVFWSVIIITLLWVCAVIGSSHDKSVRECEYFHFPCETTTTLYDPYGMGVAP